MVASMRVDGVLYDFRAKKLLRGKAFRLCGWEERLSQFSMFVLHHFGSRCKDRMCHTDLSMWKIGMVGSYFVPCVIFSHVLVHGVGVLLF